MHDLSCGSPSVQAEALGSLLDILRAFAETKSSLSKTEFPNDIFFRIQNSILETTDDSSFTMLCALLQKAMERFLDIHFYSLRNIS